MPKPTDVPIFYGAVSLYLRHRFPSLRRLPRAWFAPLDTWPVLRLAARLAAATSAQGLEDLTLSMLRGMDGRQADELRADCDWGFATAFAQLAEVAAVTAQGRAFVS